MIYWPAKPAGATLDYAFDWADLLTDGETIASKVVSANGVTVDSSDINGSNVRVWLSAGVQGVPATVTCTITTDGGRIVPATAVLPIGAEPIGLDQAKAQLRVVDDNSEDALILGLVQAAREHVEKYCGVKLAGVAGELQFARWSDLAWLPWAPIQSVAAISYLDSAGDEQLLDPSVYEAVLDLDGGMSPIIRLKLNQSWPTLRCAVDAVRVSLVAGYRVVPQPMIAAMLLLISQWFDNRAATGAAITTEIPLGVTVLLSNYRRF